MTYIFNIYCNSFVVIQSNPNEPMIRDAIFLFVKYKTEIFISINHRTVKRESDRKKVEINFWIFETIARARTYQDEKKIVRRSRRSATEWT